MSHCVEGFICSMEESKRLASKFGEVVLAFPMKLSNFAFIPMTDELYRECLKNASLEPRTAYHDDRFMDGSVESHVEGFRKEKESSVVGFMLRSESPICYIETDYFGGFGEQSAICCINGRVFYQDESSISKYASPINTSLRIMGVVKDSGMDEFDTIGLGEKRDNWSWLNND